MKKTRRLLSLLLVLTILLSAVPVTALAAASYTDVASSDWFYDAVRYVSNAGLMSGTGDGAFSPNAVTTRGMIVTVLHRMEGKPLVYGETFSDVTETAYYADAVAWASAKDIVTGYGNGRFGPDDAITREQFATILYRYAKMQGYETTSRGDVSRFADGNSVSSYAVEAMSWAVGEGLIAGTDGNKLDPSGKATRAQTAMILKRFCEKRDVPLVLDWIESLFGDEMSAAEEYYRSNGRLLSMIDAQKSEDLLTEAEVKPILNDLGFNDYPITYDYSISGEYADETEISDESSDKHPTYRTFNLESDLGIELLLSTSETLTSYDEETNKFYVTVPHDSTVIVKTVDSIDTQTLDALTVEELCRLTGATVSSSADASTVSEEPAMFRSRSSAYDAVSTTAASAQNVNDPVIVVSLGDSYSSGEGIEPFYGQDKPLYKKSKRRKLAGAQI